ncbi:MAG: T9SS type A sorting domain-containing protein, partial [Candidatus Cloacimonetes bacterium]|nr:T9SS type A sorting domain-containing protein [Candidatus Cloacimonadota bacterium]
FPYVIWNMPTYRSNLPNESVLAFEDMIRAGTNLIVIGSGGARQLFWFGNQDIHDFVNNILGTTPGSYREDANIYGQRFAEGIDFRLGVNMSTSTSVIPASNGRTLFANNDGQAVGIYTFELEGRTVLLDFNFHDISNADIRREIIERIVYWTGIVDEKDPTEIPSPAFSVNAYPNPFHQELNLTISNNKSTEISLSLYNIKGQKITQQEHNISKYKENTIKWNMNEHDLSSGIYFYKVQTNEDSYIGKVIFMK